VSLFSDKKNPPLFVASPQISEESDLRPLNCSNRIIVILASVLVVSGNICDAQTWEYLGLPDQTISGIAVKDDQTIYVSSPRLFGQTPGMIFKTTNEGSSWDTVLTDASVLDLRMHPQDEETLFAGLGSADPPYGVLKTTDGGESWFHADLGINVNGERLVRAIEFDHARPETLYVGVSGPFGGDLYKTTNGGESWTSITADGLYAGVISIAVDPFSTGTIYAGTPYAGLYKSTDGGIGWTISFPVNSPVLGIAVDPTDTDLLYVCVGNPGSGFYRSTDGGITWKGSTTGLPSNTAVAEIEVDPVSRDIYSIVFPDSVGLFKSSDLGITWHRVQGLLAENSADILVISSMFANLYVGMDNLGVYRTALTTSIVDHDTPLLTNDLVARAYPNPFNGVTTIQYEVLLSEEVSLTIHDILGREVLEYPSEKRQPGQYRAILVGKSIPSGIYFLRILTSSGRKGTVKLNLIR
jgi:photosystem II stability/assembly factor-like uncharacterized protein